MKNEIKFIKEIVEERKIEGLAESDLSDLLILNTKDLINYCVDEDEFVEEDADLNVVLNGVIDGEELDLYEVSYNPNCNFDYFVKFNASYKDEKEFYYDAFDLICNVYTMQVYNPEVLDMPTTQEGFNEVLKNTVAVCSIGDVVYKTNKTKGGVESIVILPMSFKLIKRKDYENNK